MLVTDSLKRITIEGIRNHPWFLQDLPRYLSVPIRVGQHLEHIDEAVLADVIARTHFPRDKIYKALKKGRRNHYTVAYHLIKDAQDELDTSVASEQHVKAAAAAVAAAAATATAAATAGSGSLPNSASPISAIVVPSHPSPGPGGGPRATHPYQPSRPEQPAPVSPTMSGPTDMVLQTPQIGVRRAPQAQQMQSQHPEQDANRFMPTRRWNVGIVLSRTDAAEAMLEVYRTLHKLQWRWKTLSNQTFQVRVLVDKPGLSRPVRLCLQMFKTSTGFNLDIHRLDGDMVPFLAICSQLYREIR
jgi:hypothetical protein